MNAFRRYRHGAEVLVVGYCVASLSEAVIVDQEQLGDCWIVSSLQSFIDENAALERFQPL